MSAEDERALKAPPSTATGTRTVRASSSSSDPGAAKIQKAPPVPAPLSEGAAAAPRPRWPKEWRETPLSTSITILSYTSRRFHRPSDFALLGNANCCCDFHRQLALVRSIVLAIDFEQIECDSGEGFIFPWQCTGCWAVNDGLEQVCFGCDRPVPGWTAADKSSQSSSSTGSPSIHDPPPGFWTAEPTSGHVLPGGPGTWSPAEPGEALWPLAALETLRRSEAPRRGSREDSSSSSSRQPTAPDGGANAEVAAERPEIGGGPQGCGRWRSAEDNDEEMESGGGNH